MMHGTSTALKAYSGRALLQMCYAMAGWPLATTIDRKTASVQRFLYLNVLQEDPDDG
jgi:hypothetical protein